MCPLRLDVYNGFTGYIDCTFIEYSMDDAGPTGVTDTVGVVDEGAIRIFYFGIIDANVMLAV
jgi:hypothetical protein